MILFFLIKPFRLIRTLTFPKRNKSNSEINQTYQTGVYLSWSLVLPNKKSYPTLFKYGSLVFKLFFIIKKNFFLRIKNVK